LSDDDEEEAIGFVSRQYTHNKPRAEAATTIPVAPGRRGYIVIGKNPSIGLWKKDIVKDHNLLFATILWHSSRYEIRQEDTGRD
jgi:hypothetical protein